MNDLIEPETAVSGESPLSVGSFLRARRNDKGMSQRRLAELTGITQATIKNYESGRNLPPIDRAIQLAGVLDFDARDLMAEAVRERGGSIPDEADQVDEKVTISRSALNELMTALRAGQSVELPARPDAAEMDDDDDDSITDLDAANMALIEVEEVVAGPNGVRSRKLRRVVERAEDALHQLDYDELEQIAMEELPAEWFEEDQETGRRRTIGRRRERQEKRGLLGMVIEEGEVEQAEEAFNSAVDLILVAKVYGDEFLNADLDTLEKLERPLRKAAVINYEVPILFRSKNEIDIARREFAGGLIAAIKAGKTVDVSAVFKV